jgi:hypothetical protein
MYSGGVVEEFLTWADVLFGWAEPHSTRLPVAMKPIESSHAGLTFSLVPKRGTQEIWKSRSSS